ncbi:hypothetical protein ABH37_09380 [Mycobacterium haemophilum]|uniref:Nitroreductase n=1 Tax=Mycobacterium haemophilum TaxID=29311 RepID=A0A0I9VI45_9MYCO|nr:nitroreductase/quinone reductase family protein [Mycobacterium haemophilum]KLO32697.1 hypothetical protein ABH39_05910 [Mycobacterium haemophilum]KLO36958.1 hypothetical protein ABH38_10755 [Mycobacterium haemophilum]KLO42977.1 hypothetical protein ABH37_09380 [Mycobacterium haemophilum]KLO55850.1 hypothetical protein ABH36_05065 [Mycobacterium haemophilum]
MLAAVLIVRRCSATRAPPVVPRQRRMLETIGRKTGQLRRTAVGGRLVDSQFWMVSEHGEHSDYVYNIKANPAVRVRLGGQSRSGTAHLPPDDDPRHPGGPRLIPLRRYGLRMAYDEELEIAQAEVMPSANVCKHGHRVRGAL